MHTVQQKLKLYILKNVYIVYIVYIEMYILYILYILKNVTKIDYFDGYFRFKFLRKTDSFNHRFEHLI